MAVQYALTEKGRQLRPVLESLRTWGDRWIAPTPE
jgi:DNA-binding HxlR family transcriptional regulator